MQMEKLVKQCDMELMKMAMLKHEETFRQQVHELHRLYRIQKQLMTDLNRSELSCRLRQRRRKQHRRMLNLQLPADEYIVCANEDYEAMPSGGEDALELTLAVGGRARDYSGAASLSPSSSTESEEAPGAPYQRAMAFEGMKQAPWLVQCLGLRMA